MLARRVTILCLSAYATSFSLAWQSYKSKIPSGEMGGVGHSSCTSPSSCSGGGSRNAFGSAFANAGREWNKDLCEADSDGDGQSNGLELGDPCCIWSAGDTPQFTTDLSAPGSSSSVTLRTVPDCTSSSSPSLNATSPTASQSATNSTPTGVSIESGAARLRAGDLHVLLGGHVIALVLILVILLLQLSWS